MTSLAPMRASLAHASVDTRSAPPPHLLDAVSGLSAECRRVLTLRKIYGWEYEQIARHLGIEQHEVEHDLSLCVQIMARGLDDR